MKIAPRAIKIRLRNPIAGPIIKNRVSVYTQMCEIAGKSARLQRFAAQESGGVYETTNHTNDRSAVKSKKGDTIFGNCQIFPEELDTVSVCAAHHFVVHSVPVFPHARCLHGLYPV